MKIFILFLPLLLPACTVMHGNATQNSYFYASLGGDTKDLDISPNAATAGAVNTSKSFKEGAAMAKGLANSYITGATVRGLAGITANQQVAVEKQVTKRGAIAEKGLTDRAGIAADVRKTELTSEQSFQQP